MAERRRKHWGWGYEDEHPGPDELRATVAGLADHLGFGEREPEPAVALAAVELAPPRLETPYAQDVARGEEAERWGAVKAAASEAILAAGGTITHHHAVGRDHRPYYDRQRPEPFADALRAAKAAVDPRARLNPGVLFDAR